MLYLESARARLTTIDDPPGGTEQGAFLDVNSTSGKIYLHSFLLQDNDLHFFVSRAEWGCLFRVNTFYLERVKIAKT